MFVTITDVDGFLNSNDHVDDVYAEVRLSPGQPSPEVRQYMLYTYVC